MGSAISPEVKRILEKIYNLKSRESVVLESKQKEINAIEEAKSLDKEKEKELINNIEDYTDNYSGKSDAYDTLLIGIDLKELKTTKQLGVLEDLYTDLIATVKEMQRADKNKTEAETALSEIKERIKLSETNLTELELQKEDLIRYQEALSSYVDRALNLDTGITVGEIHDLLIKLGFEEGTTDLEIAAQLIIFPKTGLIAYDMEMKSRYYNSDDSDVDGGKSISEVFAEASAKDQDLTAEEVDEEDLVSAEDDVVDEIVLDNIDIEEAEPIINESVDEIFVGADQIIDENLSSIFDEIENHDLIQETRMDLDSILNDLDLDPLEFTTRDKELIESNLNPELFAMNINTLKTSGLYNLNDRIVYEYPNFLWDKELKSKLEILTGEV